MDAFDDPVLRMIDLTHRLRSARLNDEIIQVNQTTLDQLHIELELVGERTADSDTTPLPTAASVT